LELAAKSTLLNSYLSEGSRRRECEEETPGVMLLLEIFSESLWFYASNETC